jgi:hypothetical protein
VNTLKEIEIMKKVSLQTMETILNEFKSYVEIYDGLSKKRAKRDVKAIMNTLVILSCRNLIELDNVKVCSKCGESKLLVEFQKFSYRKAGVRPECKDCSSKQKKLYRESKKSLVVSE